MMELRLIDAKEERKKERKKSRGRLLSFRSWNHLAGDCCATSCDGQADANHVGLARVIINRAVWESIRGSVPPCARRPGLSASSPSSSLVFRRPAYPFRRLRRCHHHSHHTHTHTHTAQRHGHINSPYGLTFAYRFEFT